MKCTVENVDMWFRNRIFERVMNQFLERHNLPKSTQREIDNLNRLTSVR